MNGKDTHSPAKLRTTMWTLPNYAQSSRVALRLGVELAALLGGHVEVCWWTMMTGGVAEKSVVSGFKRLR